MASRSPFICGKEELGVVGKSSLGELTREKPTWDLPTEKEKGSHSICGAMTKTENSSGIEYSIRKKDRD